MEEKKIADMWQKYSKRAVRNPRVTIRAEIRENIKSHLSPVAGRVRTFFITKFASKSLAYGKNRFFIGLPDDFLMMHLQTSEPHQVAKHPNAYTLACCKSPVSNFRYLTQNERAVC